MIACVPWTAIDTAPMVAAPTTVPTHRFNAGGTPVRSPACTRRQRSWAASRREGCAGGRRTPARPVRTGRAGRRTDRCACRVGRGEAGAAKAVSTRSASAATLSCARACSPGECGPKSGSTGTTALSLRTGSSRADITSGARSRLPGAGVPPTGVWSPPRPGGRRAGTPEAAARPARRAADAGSSSGAVHRLVGVVEGVREVPPGLGGTGSTGRRQRGGRRTEYGEESGTLDMVPLPQPRGR